LGEHPTGEIFVLPRQAPEQAIEKEKQKFQRCWRMLIKSPSETLSQSYESSRRPVGDINFASQFRCWKRGMNRGGMTIIERIVSP